MKRTITLSLAVIASSSAFAVNVFSENFDAGVAASQFAISNAVANSPVVWDDMAASLNNNYAAAAGQSNAMTADSDFWGNSAFGNSYQDSFDTTATSSTFDLTNMMNTVLTYDLNFQKNGTNGSTAPGDEDRLEVMAQAGGGGWIVLQTIAEDTPAGGLFVDNSGVAQSVDLSAFDGMADVQIAYRYVDLGGPGTWEWYAQIDNVSVDAEAVPEPASMAVLAGLAALAARRRKKA